MTNPILLALLTLSMMTGAASAQRQRTLYDADGNVVGYREKPSISHDVSMGIYLYSPKAHAWIERDTYLDFPDLILKMIAAGQKVSSYRTDCLWLDIGRHEDYALATEVFESNRDAFLPRASK